MSKKTPTPAGPIPCGPSIAEGPPDAGPALEDLLPRLLNTIDRNRAAASLLEAADRGPWGADDLIGEVIQPAAAVVREVTNTLDDLWESLDTLCDEARRGRPVVREVYAA